MKKKSFAALAAALTLTLAGCGGSEPEVDIHQMAADLTGKVAFVDELTQLDESVIPMLYDVAYSDAVLYMGSGATAEEVAVFACEDKEAAKAALEQAKTHIENQKEAYESYVPEEVKRLEEAVVEQKGKYVAVVVTGDTETAQEVLKGYWD